MPWSVVSTESRRVAVEHHAKFVSTATVFFQSHGIPMPTSAASSIEQHLTRRWMSEGWAGEHRVEILGVPFRDGDLFPRGFLRGVFCFLENWAYFENITKYSSQPGQRRATRI